MSLQFAQTTGAVWLWSSVLYR